MSLRYGVLPIGRPTFDVPYANERLDGAFEALRAAGIEAVGPRELIYDAETTKAAIADIDARGDIDCLLIIQVTFTDATMTVEVARNAGVPVSIWALPEPRIGGRLRLNAFCGLNLAAHALGREGIPHGYLYASKPDAEDLRKLATPTQAAPTVARQVSASAIGAPAMQALEALRGATIAVIGKHPDGFDTCRFNEEELSDLTGVSVRELSLDTLFETAGGIDPGRVSEVRLDREAKLSGVDSLNQEELNRSFQLFCALEDMQEQSDARALAVRCWPETFTEFGCAACGPMAMMNEKKVPSACEADVYGSLSALLMQELSGEPSWMADLVDLDFDDDTGVLWHCGLAPLTMCDPDAVPEATIHTNRKMPLLHQFPLKPGIVTIVRLSQSRNETKLVIGIAEFVKAPMAFTGTSGVIKLKGGARQVFDTIMAEGLEHHYALAYGDYRDALRDIASALDLPILDLNANSSARAA